MRRSQNTMLNAEFGAAGPVFLQGTGMRVFLGFPASEDIRSYVHRTQAALRTQGVRGKWVDPSKAHWTVLFLGEQSPEAVSRMEERLSSTLPSAQAPVLRCTDVGSFSPHPRLLFLGWAEAASGRFPALTTLTARCAEDAEIPIDPAASRRKAHPHLTLVRFRNPRESQRARSLGALHGGRWRWRAELPSPSPATRRVVCDRLVLFQSHLRPEGPVYEELCDFRLDTARLHMATAPELRGVHGNAGQRLDPDAPYVAPIEHPSAESAGPRPTNRQPEA